MNKKALWDKFIRTGKISDYLRYRRAERIARKQEEYDLEDDDEEFADELYPDYYDEEVYDYDDEDEWYSNS